MSMPVESPQSSPHTFDNHAEKLLLGLLQQRVQGQYCDLTVKVKDKELSAHTAVVAVFAPKATFTPVLNGYLLVLDDFPASILEPLLTSMYSQMLQCNKEDVAAVMAAARNLGYKAAELACSEYMSTHPEPGLSHKDFVCTSDGRSLQSIAPQVCKSTYFDRDGSESIHLRLVSTVSSENPETNIPSQKTKDGDNIGTQSNDLKKEVTHNPQPDQPSLSNDGTSKVDIPDIKTEDLDSDEYDTFSVSINSYGDHCGDNPVVSTCEEANETSRQSVAGTFGQVAESISSQSYKLLKEPCKTEAHVAASTSGPSCILSENVCATGTQIVASRSGLSYNNVPAEEPCNTEVQMAASKSSLSYVPSEEVYMAEVQVKIEPPDELPDEYNPAMFPLPELFGRKKSPAFMRVSDKQTKTILINQTEFLANFQENLVKDISSSLCAEDDVGCSGTKQTASIMSSSVSCGTSDLLDQAPDDYDFPLSISSLSKTAYEYNVEDEVNAKRKSKRIKKAQEKQAHKTNETAQSRKRKGTVSSEYVPAKLSKAKSSSSTSSIESKVDDFDTEVEVVYVYPKQPVVNYSGSAALGQTFGKWTHGQKVTPAQEQQILPKPKPRRQTLQKLQPSHQLSYEVVYPKAPIVNFEKRSIVPGFRSKRKETVEQTFQLNTKTRSQLKRKLINQGRKRKKPTEANRESEADNRDKSTETGKCASFHSISRPIGSSATCDVTKSPVPKFQSRTEVEDSHQDYTSPSMYTCTPCKMNFQTFVHYTSHLHNSHDDQMFMCQNCQLVFTSEQSFKKHNKAVHLR